MPVNPSLIGDFLEAVLKAKPHQVANYGQLATKFGLPDLDGAWRSHPLSQIFEVLDQEDALAGRPFRTSVVVGVVSNSPGPGFFEALERLKGIPDPKTAKARETLWLKELAAANSYPWP
jgi:hypothetical protein